MEQEKSGRGSGGAQGDAQRRKRDLASVRKAITALREATGIPVTMGGVVGEGHTLVLSESLGMRTSAMKDLKVHYGAGVGGNFSWRTPIRRGGGGEEPVIHPTGPASRASPKGPRSWEPPSLAV